MRTIEKEVMIWPGSRSPEPSVRGRLAPEFKPGDVVVMDNLSSDQRAGVCALIEAAGARLLFLPPYSPDRNPIEKAFARLKAMLRKSGERTVSGLWHLIAGVLMTSLM